MTPHFASPGDDYLRRIGELAYAVSSLEWTLLGDLHRLSATLPATLTVSELAGATTGRIARQLRQGAALATAPEVATYLIAGGDALAEVAELRNAVLHARPTTIDGEQRLYRWRSQPAEAYAISDDWFDDALARVAKLARQVNAARPSFDAYPA